MAGCGWNNGFQATTPLLCYARGTILFLLIIPLAHAQPVSFDYPNFGNVDPKLLTLEGDAYFSDSHIELTGNRMGPPSEWFGSVGRVGRVRRSNLIHIWKQDFTTNFSFVVSSNNSAFGGGLAFFVASPNPPNTTDIGGGGGLGLLPAHMPLSIDNYSFVAVEFDTHQDYWDPPNLHVGVNINSMKSEKHREWLTDIAKGDVCNCSVQYNSGNNNLNVCFTGSRIYDGPITQTPQCFSYHIDITENLPETVIVGISAATGIYSEEYTLLSWSFSTSLPIHAHPKKERKLIRKILFKKILLEGIGIGVGLSLSLVGLPLSLVGLVRILLPKKNEGNEEEPTSETTSDLKMDDEFQINTGPKKMSYYELKNATNNFEETQKLGQGGFGGVYKGYLKDSNSFVAIKRISANSRQGTKQYAAEVTIISQLRHRNLVKLAGWCHKKNDLFLIYEYMPNGSLDSHLFRGESILSWQLRYNIALGLSSALLYLQEGWEKCVLHRDIKSSNILLDSNFKAKLGDFGLARLVDHEKGSQTTVVAGTMGYLAPEYINTGKARKESDIFSFGVVLLELASGRKAIHHNEKEGEVSLVEWIWQLYGIRNLLAAVDPKLCGVFDVQQMVCLLVVGLWSANPDCTSRPCIRKVIKVLNFEAPLPILPQQMPVLAYLPPTTNEFFYTVSSSSPATR